MQVNARCVSGNVLDAPDQYMRRQAGRRHGKPDRKSIDQTEERIRFLFEAMRALYFFARATNRSR
jgi:hypothetical protein